MWFQTYANSSHTVRVLLCFWFMITEIHQTYSSIHKESEAWGQYTFEFSGSWTFNMMPLSLNYFCFLTKYLKMKTVSNSNSTAIFLCILHTFTGMGLYYKFTVSRAFGRNVSFMHVSQFHSSDFQILIHFPLLAVFF